MRGLKSLREATGVTQTKLAEDLGMTQSEVSKMESRNDHLVSSVRRYVEALGGELEIVVVVRGKRIRLQGV